MRNYVNLAAVLSISAVITYYSVRPFNGYGQTGLFDIMKLYHVAAYFALAAALLLYFHDTPKGHIEAILVASLFGAGIELIQQQIPFRVFSVTDILLNGLGASLVLLDHRLSAVTKIIRVEDAVLAQIIPGFDHTAD